MIFVLFQELTLADTFMVGVYCFIFVSFIVTITMLRLQRDNYFYFAGIFYSYTEGWVCSTQCFVVFSFCFPCFVFFIPFLNISACCHVRSYPIATLRIQSPSICDLYYALSHTHTYIYINFFSVCCLTFTT